MRNSAVLWRIPLFTGARDGVARPVGNKKAETLNRPAVDENHFARLVAIERKRSELSGGAFVVAHISRGEHSSREFNDQLAPAIVKALGGAIREIDTIGWHTTGSILGVLFTEVKVSDSLDALVKAITARLTTTLTKALGHTRISVECTAHGSSLRGSARAIDTSTALIAAQAGRSSEGMKRPGLQTL